MANTVIAKPFEIAGKTAILAVLASSARVAIPSPGDAASGATTNQVAVANDGANTIFVNFGGSDVVAVIPTAGTPAKGYAILPGHTESFSVVVSVDKPTYMAAIAAATGNNAYVTPGIGS